MKTWTLVTGGAKRLGARLCIDLAAQGHSILIHYHTSRQEAEEVAKGCRAFGADAEIIYGDFSSSVSVDHFIQACREDFSIGTLINNVGNYLIKPAAKTTIQEWNEIFQTNLHTPFALSNAFLGTIIENRGSIINLGIAGMSSLRAEIYSTAYMSAKMALLVLTKSLACELAPRGVRVNMVSPGYLENAIDLPKDVLKLPMHRAATLEEISRMVTFLLDERNCYITGQNIEVAGGVRL